MKTAIEELLLKLESEIGNSHLFTLIVNDFEIYLEKEKDQIAMAYENGAFDFQDGKNEVTNGDGVDYYNNTYRK